MSVTLTDNPPITSTSESPKVLSVYLNDFLQNQRGLTIEHATAVVFVLKMATLVGQVVGSKLGQLAYNRRSELQPLLMGVSE